MRADLRRARYGYLLAVPLVLLCAAGRTPSEIAAVLFCSRSTVSRVVKAYRAGELEWALGEEGVERAARRRTVLSLALQRAVLAILKAAPRAWGWCRTRWSCATGALELQARRGLAVSAETVRRWIQALGGEWQRAKLVAKDDDPQRVVKLARIRLACEQLRAGAALFFAHELDISLLPKVGYQWTPKGTQVAVRTPGTNEKRYLAGALHIRTGTTAHGVWYRKTTGLFLDLLATLEHAYPAQLFTRLSVVVDHAKIHHAEEVAKWLASPPRFELLSLPTYCPRANPIERAFGEVQDKCPRTHTRKRMWPLVQDVKQHLPLNGPWPYALSELYYTPAVTAAVQALRVAEAAPEELSQLAA
jgi:transposase